MQIEKWNRTTTLQPEKPEVIFDDAFQHRKVKVILYFTDSYDDLYQMIGYTHWKFT
jgi:hypothetical protein